MNFTKSNSKRNVIQKYF